MRIRTSNICINIPSNICNRLGKMIQSGLTPPSAMHDPVAWRPREFNKLADGLADLTMDRRAGWTRRYTLTEDAFNGNCLAFSDGGKRSVSVSAAAWLLVVLFWEGDQWRVEPWAAGGIFLHDDATVFEAEAIGLDAAVAFLSEETANSGRVPPDP